MLRTGRTVGTLVCGVGVALLAAAQPAEVPADAQPTPGAADLIGLDLAQEVWQHVVPDMLTPLPRANAQPAQWSSAIVRAGEVTVIARAQRDVERRADASLRELHASISYAERQELQMYVDAARIDLPQVRPRPTRCMPSACGRSWWAWRPCSMPIPSAACSLAR